MKMASLIAALASIIAVLPVHADDAANPDAGAPRPLIETRITEASPRGSELGIELFNQDTHAALPTTVGNIQPTSGSVLGLQLTYLYVMSALYFTAQGGYGIGGQTIKQVTPVSQKDEIRLKMLMLSMGLGYAAPITRQIGIHTTLQLMYESTVATQKFGGNEDDGPAFNALGLALALGTTYRLSQQLKFRAELYNLYAYGWISEDEAELLDWVKFSCYRVGLSRSF